MTPLTAYWWSPLHDRRALLSEVRHNNVAWLRMRNFGGEWLRNFGDELSVSAINHAFGAKPSWVPIADADVVAIGSILELYLNRGGTGKIWGTGLRNPQVPIDVSFDLASVLAVRGTGTRDALGLPSSIPLGDPGLLARNLYTAPDVRTGTLIVPHFSVFKSQDGYALIKRFADAGMKVVAPSSPVDVVCREIAQASHLITSSLHGVIVGDALRTPTTLARFVDTREPEFKYFDYSSIYGETPQFEPAQAAFDPARQRSSLDAARRRLDRIDSVIDRVNMRLLESTAPMV